MRRSNWPSVIGALGFLAAVALALYSAGLSLGTDHIGGSGALTPIGTGAYAPSDTQAVTPSGPDPNQPTATSTAVPTSPHTPTPTPSPAPTPSDTPIPTPTPALAPTATATLAPTPTSAPPATPTARPTFTATATRTAAPLPTARPSATPTRGAARVDADPEPYAACGIRNFAWTERGVLARGEQPPAESLRCLRDEKGIRAVVNLRLEGSGYDEKAAVESLGMDYLSLPMEDDTAPSPEQVSQYLAFVDAHRRAGQPVYEHCAGGRGRAGTMEGSYLLWKGWTTADVLARYVRFGAKIDCENGGNGQVQALHEMGLLLGRGDAWPDGKDSAGAVWPSCPRPAYMAGWDYRVARYP